MDGLQPGDPESVGGYRLLARLGAGGMGQVFLGESPGGRKVAVKLIYPVHAGTRERFAREIDAARRVGGFHTAPVVDADPYDNPPWMVTAFIDGPSLEEAVGRYGPLPPGRVRELGAGLADGLAAIHAHGLVHRDLKPGNVIMAQDGPRIIDFGIARAMDAATLTAAGSVVGTLAYMSPEQVRGDRVMPASDVFSLGCVLAFAATGRPPFGDGTAAMFRLASQPPDLAGLADEELRELITGCLAKSADDRSAVRYVLAALARPGPAPPSARAPAGAVPLAATVGTPTQPYTPAPTETSPGREALSSPGMVSPSARAAHLRPSRNRPVSRSRRRPAVLVAAAVVIVALAVVLSVLLTMGKPGAEPGAASAQITSPAIEAHISRGSEVIIKGKAENLDGESLWIFIQASDTYYVNNSYPIAVDAGQWQFDDQYIGTDGAGAYVINVILANPSCTTAIESAKAQPGGGKTFKTLPGGCSIGDTRVVNVTP